MKRLKNITACDLTSKSMTHKGLMISWSLSSDVPVFKDDSGSVFDDKFFFAPAILENLNKRNRTQINYSLIIEWTVKDSTNCDG